MRQSRRFNLGFSEGWVDLRLCLDCEGFGCAFVGKGFHVVGGFDLRLRSGVDILAVRLKKIIVHPIVFVIFIFQNV